MKEPYVVKLEIAGLAAMFTRPDSGSGPISYQSPTHSAAKGIFETVGRILGNRKTSECPALLKSYFFILELVDLFRRFGTVTRVEK